MIAGYKTITWISGVLLAVTTSPEMQALIQEHPVAAFWINNVVLAILRWYTVSPLPWRKLDKFQPTKE